MAVGRVQVKVSRLEDVAVRQVQARDSRFEDMTVGRIQAIRDTILEDMTGHRNRSLRFMTVGLVQVMDSRRGDRIVRRLITWSEDWDS